jgi:hypothetical protein
VDLLGAAHTIAFAAPANTVLGDRFGVTAIVAIRLIRRRRALVHSPMSSRALHPIAQARISSAAALCA